MGVRPEPDELDVLQKGYFRERTRMVVRIGRNRQRRVRLLPLDRRIVSLRSILWQELLRRRRLRHGEADAALVDDR